MTAATEDHPRQRLFLITPTGEARDVLGSGFSEAVPTFRTVGHFLDDEASRTSGCVLLPAEVGPEEVRTLLTALADRPGPWTPVLVEWSGGHGVPRENAGRTLRATPVSLGFPEPLDVLVDRLRGDEDEAVERLPLLELRTVLEEVGRTRHDINNPLTAALAETQLLLMDLEEGEVREAVAIVETQLRRIRDLVARLSSVRPPGSQKTSSGRAPSA